MKLLVIFACFFFVQSLNDYRRRNNWIPQSRNPEEAKQKLSFLQVVDHFDPFNKKTFSQYYFLNYDYALETYPKNVILFIGGEYTLTQEYLTRGFITNIAREFRAVIVGLEHRHYGDSILPGNYTKKDYGTLSSQQALADLVTFKWHLNEVILDIKNIKWITMGSSYAGMLSSWARIKFPHLFYASIASSAPVEGKLQFDGFFEVVSEAYAFEPVGGSKNCTLAIKEIFDEIDKIYLESNNTSVYDSKLSACQATETFFERQNLIEQIADAYAGIVQYNAPRNSMNIKNVCEIMEGIEDPWDRIEKFIQTLKEEFTFECFDPKMKTFMSLLKSKKPSNEKSWLFQTCKEFGFYTQCDKANGCIFSSLIRSVAYTVLCPEIFDINDHMISGYIHFTNSYYGGRKPNGSRIIYVNGAIDPWHTRGVHVNDLKRDQLSILIKDGSHHQEFYEARSDDSSSLKKARETIIDTLKKWLQ